MAITRHNVRVVIDATILIDTNHKDKKKVVEHFIHHSWPKALTDLSDPGDDSVTITEVEHT